MALRLGVNPNHNGGIILSLVKDPGREAKLHNDPDLRKAAENEQMGRLLLPRVHKGSGGDLFTCGLLLIGGQNDYSSVECVGASSDTRAATLLICTRGLTAQTKRCYLFVVTKRCH